MRKVIVILAAILAIYLTGCTSANSVVANEDISINVDEQNHTMEILLPRKIERLYMRISEINTYTMVSLQHPGIKYNYEINHNVEISHNVDSHGRNSIKLPLLQPSYVTTVEYDVDVYARSFIKLTIHKPSLEEITAAAAVEWSNKYEPALNERAKAIGFSNIKEMSDRIVSIMNNTKMVTERWIMDISYGADGVVYLLADDLAKHAGVSFGTVCYVIRLPRNPKQFDGYIMENLYIVREAGEGIYRHGYSMDTCPIYVCTYEKPSEYALAVKWLDFIKRQDIDIPTEIARKYLDRYIADAITKSDQSYFLLLEG